MKLSLAIAMLFAAATAQADDLVKVPDGYKADPDQATALAGKANQVSHFGGARSLATSDAFVGPHGALFVTAVAGKVSSVDRNAAARVAVDELHDATTRAALASNGIVVDSWNTKSVVAQKLVQGDLVWRDTSAGSTTTARILVVADDENVVAVTGECVSADKPDPVCVKALESLDPGVALAKRKDIGLAAPGTMLAAPTADPDPQPSMAGSSSAAQPGMSETPSSMGHTPLPPMTISTDREKPAKDRRPVYVGLGIVVLATAFWWNQRRRARFEKDSDD